jgi:hypothetical protein
MLITRPFPLLDKSDGGGSGGGDPAKPFSDEQQTAIAQIVNSAVTSQLKRGLGPAIGDALKGMNWAEALKLDETLDAKLGKILNDLEDGADPDKGGTDGKPPAKPDTEIQRQLTKLAEDLEKEKAARQAALAEAAEMKRSHEFGTARQKLYEALKPHASETLHDVWVDNLIHHKRLKVEEGAALLEVEYAPVKGLPKQKDFLPLEEAITHLVASDEAKRFRPAPGTEGGAGSPGPRGARRQATASLESKDPAERVRARLEGMGINYDAEFGS